MNVLPALIISLLIPLGFLYFVHKLDLYGTGKFRYNTISISAGMIASLLASLIHTIIVVNGWMNKEQIIQEVAPISEELLKAFILFYLVRRADFNYVVDGAIYGVGAGFGFAMAETFFYIMGAHESAFSLALNRSFSANLIHATTTGLVGSALAAGQLGRGPKRVSFSVAGLILAMGLHMAFNFMVTTSDSLVPAILAGLFGFACITGIIKINLYVQHKWIAETLGMTDQVTMEEAAVVQRIQNMDDVLAPIARQFGIDKALKTEALIHLQAEIGIKRKIAKETADKNRRAAIEIEIKRLRSEMDAIRKAIGLYCMIFVRSVYLARGNRLWDLLNARVHAAGQGHVRGDLWSTLDRRIKKSKAKALDHEQ